MQFTPVTGNEKSRTPLSEIPDEFRMEVEEVHEWSVLNPGKRLQTEPFPSREDADAWLSLARSYAYQRPDETGGRIVVTGNTAQAPAGTAGFVARIRTEPFVKTDTP